MVKTMGIKVLKLDVKLADLKKETHDKYGDSYSFDVSGDAGFSSTGINVEVEGKLMVMRLFNKKTDTVMQNGKNLYVPAVSLKEVKASLPVMLKAEAVKALEAAQKEIADLKAKLAEQGSFDTSKVAKVKA